METVSISKFKATCLELLARVQRTGEPILVTKRGQPIAEVVPPPAPATPGAWLGAMKGTGRMKGDLVAPVCGSEEWEVLAK